jgi:hypothetical protein
VSLKLRLHVKFAFSIRMILRVIEAGPSCQNSIPTLSSFSPGHSRNVRTGQRESAGIGHGNKLHIGKCIHTY